LSQIRKSYRNEPQNTTTHCLTVSKSGEPKIWTIVQIFGSATMRPLWFFMPMWSDLCDGNWFEQYPGTS
jgi:hypothetical protein